MELLPKLLANLDINDIIQFNKNKESTESYAENITVEKLTPMKKIDSACSEWNEDLKLKFLNRLFGESTSSLEKIIFAFLCKTGQIVGCPAINETHYIDFCRKKFVDLMIKNEIGIKPSHIVNDIDDRFFIEN